MSEENLWDLLAIIGMALIGALLLLAFAIVTP